MVRELWLYMRIRKKYWLAPTILMLLIIGALIVASQTSAGPLMYTIF